MHIHARERVLKSGHDSMGREHFLIYHPEGEYIAGAGTRHDKACLIVAMEFEGARHGNAFTNSRLALECFNKRVAR